MRAISEMSMKWKGVVWAEIMIYKGLCVVVVVQVEEVVPVRRMPECDCRCLLAVVTHILDTFIFHCTTIHLTSELHCKNTFMCYVCVQGRHSCVRF